jgi:hypothetical protein
MEVSLALKCLNDNNTYEHIHTNPLITTSHEISNCIFNLISETHVSDKLGNLLITKEGKLGKFRILPKIHKKGVFGLRPIINSINSPTNKICLFIFIILQPVVIRSESYLQDSQHLLQILDKLNLKDSKENKCFLYSCDFEALYTNIDLKLALVLILETVREFDCLDSKHILLMGFKRLLELVFNHNFFSFNDTFYKQIKSIAMGAICGPVIANIVVYKLERKWLNIQKPILYKRFIDDIFIISNKKINESHFQKYFGDLKLNIVKDEKVQFLDLSISYNAFFNRIDTSLYIKPTNTFSYLRSNSNQKKSIFDNIPKSIFIRARRICSSYLDYLKFSRIFFSQLIDRGYSANSLSHIIRSIGNLDRKELIEYKNKTDLEIYMTKNFWLISDYFSFDFNYNNLIKNAWNNFSTCNIKINKLDLKLNLAISNMNNLKKKFYTRSKIIIKKLKFRMGFM